MKISFMILVLLMSPAFDESYVNNPSILWDPRNPIFQSNFLLAVLPNSRLKIVCPNRAMNPTTLQGSIPLEQLYENFLIVDKQSYDTCTVDPSNGVNRLLMKCNKPLELEFFTIVFQRFSAIGPDGLEFEPGKEYYFTATSTGSISSLEQLVGGRCATHNMRMAFYVCKNTNDPQCQKRPNTSQPPAAKTVTMCASRTPTIQLTSTTLPNVCSVATDNPIVNEIINDTRLIPSILNHTTQLTDLWAQVQQLNNKVDAVQRKLENCTMGSGSNHVTPTPTIAPTPKPAYDNCAALYQAGFTASGVYNITAGDSNGSFPVFCDQTTAGGGWTVIQKRFDGSVRFSNQTWVAYKNGFGNVLGEFWLGLDSIFRLTRTPVTLRFDLGAPSGETRFAVYKGFTIQGADQKYKLTSGRYSAGNAGDSFSFEDGSFFSTIDQDNDDWNNHCAKVFKSGWWHGVCHKASLNGLYLNGTDKNPDHFAAGITWHSWKGYDYFLTKSEMKIKPGS